MTHLKKLSSNCEFGELKNPLIKYIIVIGVIDESLSERNGNSIRPEGRTNKNSRKTKKKQEAEIYKIKFNRKENSYSQPKKDIIKQCKYCGRTHMRGTPAFHQTCNNCHKKGHFANVCMSTNKSLNYLDNENTPPRTAEDNFFVGVISDISNEVKNNNKQINTIAEDTNTEWSVTLNTNGTSICYKINSGAQVNVIPEKQIETLQKKPKNNKMSNHPKCIQLKQYTSKRKIHFRYTTSRKERSIVIYCSSHEFSTHHRTEIEPTIKPY